MVIKIMDAGDVRTWQEICTRIEEACEMMGAAPKILEEDEEFDGTYLLEVRTLKCALDAVKAEGLYPAYIPTSTL